MSGYYTIMIHEMIERRRVLMAAVAAALLPLLAPLGPAMQSFSAAEIRWSTAIIICTWFLLILGLILGASVFSRDLSENRLGFYFSRPLSAGAIWWGKLTGVYLTLLAAGCIILVPSMLIGPIPAGMGRVRLHSLLVGGDPEGAVERFTGETLLAALALLLLTVLAGHTAALLVRSRTVWTAPVAAGLVLTAVLVWIASRPLLQIFHEIPFSRVAGLLLLLIGITLLTAGFLQIRQGRADIRCGARIMSLTITAGLLLTGLVYAGYARWLASPTPEDTIDLMPMGMGPDGPWMTMRGTVTRGGGAYRLSFLLDPVAGRWIRKGLEWGASNRTVYSADGTSAVWMVTDDLSDVPVYRVVRADLAGETPVVSEPGISIPGWAQAFAMSPDGTRLASVTDGVLQVHEIDTGKRLVSHRLEDIRRWRKLLFAGPDTVRIHEIVESGKDHERLLRISELHITTNRCEETGTIGAVTFHSLIQLDWIRATDRLIVKTPDLDAEPFLLCDGRNGGTIRELAHDGVQIEDAVPLADGRIVAAGRVSDGSLALVGYDPDGNVVTTIELPGQRHVRIGAEVSLGRVALAVSPAVKNLPPWRIPSDREQWNSLIVDMQSGEVVLLEGNICPLSTEVNMWTSPLDGDLKPGSCGTRLFRDMEHRERYLLLDSDTNELKSLVGVEGSAEVPG